ncbi:hypothetical protein PVA44_06250 [Entomospira nematocerorum]|uniref:Uncharacterized protein n=1 Tax=Entomospira nematocerorum TaxID=2719987 RepID=A0A968GDV2_9SPIO|nr:hypothetical protein [Entomospira nematocera]NIZ46378.1 hypothetical protein [Entomospira nematocera]WDI33818.1 hypothetical protein PVA44_06250 [Entomospira nematocera]
MENEKDKPIDSANNTSNKTEIINSATSTTNPSIAHSINETETVAGIGIAASAIVAGTPPLAAGILALGAVKGFNDLTKL